MNQVFLSLGGNVGDTASILLSSLRDIEALDEIYDFKAAEFYLTTPATLHLQRNFIHTACSFTTKLSLEVLETHIERIKKSYGHTKTEGPQPLNINIICYEGTRPFPKWDKKLYILVPLSDLTETIPSDERPLKTLIEPLEMLQREMIYPMDKLDTIIESLPLSPEVEANG